jgi:hypothetical protein
VSDSPELTVCLKSSDCNRLSPIEVALIAFENSIQPETRDEYENSEEAALNDSKFYLLTEG